MRALPGWLAAAEASFDRAVDGWLYCPAIRDGDGRIVDFDIVYANAAATRALRSTSRQLLRGTQRELFPAIVRNGLFEAYVDVVETGKPLYRSFWYDDGALSGYYDLTVSPSGDGFLACFSNRTSATLQEAEVTAGTTGREDRRTDVHLRLAPVRAEDGTVLDFVVEELDEDTLKSTGDGEARGKRVTEVFPGVRGDGWFDAYLRVLAGEGPLEYAATYDSTRVPGVYETRMELVDGCVEVRGRNLTSGDGGTLGDGLNSRAMTSHVVVSSLANVRNVDDVLDVLLHRSREAVGARSAAVLVDDIGSRVHAVTDEHRDDVLDALARVQSRNRRDVLTVGESVWVMFPLLKPSVTPAPSTARGAWGLAFPSWDDENADLLLAIATQCALAIDRTTLQVRQAELARQLELERLTLRIALDSLAEGVVACDPSGRITVVNRAAKELDGGEQIVRSALADLLDGRPVDQREATTDGGRTLLLSGRRLEAEGQDVLGAVVALHDVTERTEFERELAFRGTHDPLTGLANRVLLQDRLEQAAAQLKRDGGGAAVLLLDLDRFKVVNDSLGHIVGDALLVEVAARLHSCAREVDLLARLGGDEFVFVLDGGLQAATQVWQRVRDVLSQPIDVGAAHDAVVMQASGGVVLAEPDDRPVDLLRKADQAMYWAKQNDPGELAVFDTGMAARARRRLRVEQEVRAGLGTEGLTLVWQPIVDLRSGTVTGAEALVRLRRADGSLAPPAEFLDVAEESGLMNAVGGLVLSTVLDDLRAFRTAGLPPLLAHVNLSAGELAGSAVPSAALAVAARIAEEELGTLAVELTESALLGLGPALDDVLARFRSAGMRLAVDDFGTGWSSLTYLRRLPLDCVKIDRSFVGGVTTTGGDRQIVAAVASLAKSLDLDSIAEGVETADQLRELRRMGCRYAQGYLFGRPMPREAFIAHVRSQSGRTWDAC